MVSLPLLAYKPISQNQRVQGFEVPGDEQPFIYSTCNSVTSGGIVSSEMDMLIAAAYRQIFNEQQCLESNRQRSLESQLRSGAITVRDFMGGLATSDTFRQRNYDVNDNYRFVQMCVQRLLGRDVYGDQEKYAWSIVLATQGLQGFIRQLLNSEEYLTTFGNDTVPYQRRRILPQRTEGSLPFARMPRYGDSHRQQLEQLGYNFSGELTYRWSWQRPPYPKVARQVGSAITIFGAVALAGIASAVVLSWFGLITL